MKIKTFWILWGFAALICAIVLVFFFIGLADGSVSSFNIGIWLVIMIALIIIIGGSLLANKHNYPVLGMVLLLLLAVPGLLFGLILFLMTAANTSWN